MSQTLSLSKVINPKPGWYRGDFHAHTNFSDGHYDPPNLVDVARSEGLDFFTITDHNTIDAFPHFGPPADMLIIPGIEITLKEGHFNIFGLEGTPAWLTRISTDQNRIKLQNEFDTFTKLMRQTAVEGLLNSINHPLLVPWAWLDNTTDLRNLHCLEIWNDPSWPDNITANPQAVEMWSRWLNAGYRLTAIGGSDYHRPQPKPGENKPAERLGLPSTYVYAEELSGTAILNGLRQRRAYVSMGPQVTFEAKANGRTYGIGADAGKLEGIIEFSAGVGRIDGSLTARLMKNGQALAEATIVKDQLELQWSDQAMPSEAAWYRLDVLDQQGEILAVTNPIFAGPRREPEQWTYGDFVNRV